MVDESGKETEATTNGRRAVSVARKNAERETRMRAKLRNETRKCIPARKKASLDPVIFLTAHHPYQLFFIFHLITFIYFYVISFRGGPAIRDRIDRISWLDYSRSRLRNLTRVSSPPRSSISRSRLVSFSRIDISPGN